VLFDYFDDLNWLAVIVAALAFWVLGAIWYSDALFGRQWRAAAGVDEMKPTAQQIVGNLVTWFISALVLGLIAKGIGAENVGDGLVLGLVVSFGFIGTNRITQQLCAAQVLPASGCRPKPSAVSADARSYSRARAASRSSTPMTTRLSIAK
jgi:hypothetical protein